MINQNSCFLFLGPETGEKQSALNELRKKIGNNIEENVYYAGETPVPQIVSAMRNGSLFAESRLFIVKNSGNIKKAEDITLFSSYISSPQNNTFLVFIAEENSIAKNLEKAVPASGRRVFYELSDDKKAEWVKNFFRKEGFILNDDAVLTILELVENNTEALRQECSRLVLFLEKDRETGPEEVEKWLSHTREESVFTLFSRIASGDYNKSLECLRILMAAKPDFVKLLSSLLWCFKKLQDYITLTESGVTDEWEFRKIGVIAPQARRDYSRAARLYDSYAAETLISLTAEYDFKIREANTFSKQILLDEYLYKIHFCAVR